MNRHRLARQSIGRGAHGVAVFYTVVVLVALLAVASLAVDLGHVWVVRSELQCAADASARYAAAHVGDGVDAAAQAALDAAGDNTADGTPVRLDAALDVEFGTWDKDAASFTVLTGAARADANAVRVTARRVAARGNPVSLLLAQLIGRASCDVHAVSIASCGDGPAGYVGLTLTRMFDVTRFDSYRSADGPYSVASARSQAVLMGAKDLWLHDTCRVSGEAHWGLAGSLVKDAGAVVWPGPLSQWNKSLSFAPVTVGRYATTNDNARLPAGYLSGTSFNLPGNSPPQTVPGGIYYLTRFDLGAGTTLQFSGAATIYVNGDSKIQGELAHVTHRPNLLHIKLTAGSKCSIEDGGRVYAMVYGPGADVHHHNGGQSFGSVISDLLCFRQNSEGHFDESLGSAGREGGVNTVK